MIGRLEWSQTVYERGLPKECRRIQYNPRAGLCCDLSATTKPAELAPVRFFFGAYSLFSGFGYLIVDPLLASPDSPADWAKIVMLVGGWGVRVPIFIVR